MKNIILGILTLFILVSSTVVYVPFNITNPVNGEVLSYNSTSGQWENSAAGIAESTTASNGLTLTGVNVALGGTLTGNTDIANAGNILSTSGAGSFVVGNTANTLGTKLFVDGTIGGTGDMTLNDGVNPEVSIRNGAAPEVGTVATYISYNDVTNSVDITANGSVVARIGDANATGVGISHEGMANRGASATITTAINKSAYTWICDGTTESVGVTLTDGDEFEVYNPLGSTVTLGISGGSNTIADGAIPAGGLIMFKVIGSSIVKRTN